MSDMAGGPEMRAPERVFLRWIHGLNRINYYLIASLLGGMCLLAMLQVIVRLTLNISGVHLSVPWSEELGRSLMIWLIFLGAAYACRYDQMIALTFIADALPASMQRIMDAVSALLSVAFYGLLVSVGMAAASFGWMELSPVLQLPKAYVYYAMPVGAAMMIVNTLALLVERGVFHAAYRRASVNGDLDLAEGASK
jgi:TRAP-type C4-dicarboxylate transport system permease small subunit